MFHILDCNSRIREATPAFCSSTKLDSSLGAPVDASKALFAMMQPLRFILFHPNVLNWTNSYTDLAFSAILIDPELFVRAVYSL